MKPEDCVSLAPNVYVFVGSHVRVNPVNEVYITYHAACEEKHSNRLRALSLFESCEQRMLQASVKEEVVYETYVNLALLHTEMGGFPERIYGYYEKASGVYSDRSEPYFYGGLYSLRIGEYRKALEWLKKSLSLDYEVASKKYPSTQRTAYDVHVHDAFAKACVQLSLNPKEELNAILCSSSSSGSSPI